MPASLQSTSLRSGDPVLSYAAWAVLAGALLSGPLGLLATFVDPQPAWIDGQTYVDHYRPWHQIPFWFGFAFAGAWIALYARLAALADAAKQTAGFATLVMTAVYGAIISINYTLQVVSVPAAVAAGDPNVAYFTMSNPGSPAWALEMFGYAALAVANGLSAELFPRARSLRPLIVKLMYANAVAGVAGAILTAISARWVATGPGLVAYLGWNVLVIVTAAVIAIEYRPR
jgi:hypothetical protein